MKKVACACRALYPFSELEMLSNDLQNLLRKAEQIHSLQLRYMLAMSVRWSVLSWQLHASLRCTQGTK